MICLSYAISISNASWRGLQIVMLIASMERRLHLLLLFCHFFLILSSTAISDYKQSLQFQSLNEEKRNIHLQVCFYDFLWSPLSLSLSLSFVIFFLDFYLKIRKPRLFEVAEELRYLYMT